MIFFSCTYQTVLLQLTFTYIKSIKPLRKGTMKGKPKLVCGTYSAFSFWCLLIVCITGSEMVSLRNKGSATYIHAFLVIGTTQQQMMVVGRVMGYLTFKLVFGVLDQGEQDSIAYRNIIFCLLVNSPSPQYIVVLKLRLAENVLGGMLHTYTKGMTAEALNNSLKPLDLPWPAREVHHVIVIYIYIHNKYKDIL